jgi:hypothetical protein
VNFNFDSVVQGYRTASSELERLYDDVLQHICSDLTMSELSRLKEVSKSMHNRVVTLHPECLFVARIIACEMNLSSYFDRTLHESKPWESIDEIFHTKQKHNRTFRSGHLLKHMYVLKPVVSENGLIDFLCYPHKSIAGPLRLFYYNLANWNDMHTLSCLAFDKSNYKAVKPSIKNIINREKCLRVTVDGSCYLKFSNHIIGEGVHLIEQCKIEKISVVSWTNYDISKISSSMSRCLNGNNHLQVFKRKIIIEGTGYFNKHLWSMASMIAEPSVILEESCIKSGNAGWQ